MSRLCSKALSVFTVGVLLLSLLPPVPPTARAQTAFSFTGIFRTHLTLPDAASRSRLAALGVVVLAEGNGDHPWALVLATADQLETLSELGFTPLQTDDLGDLVAAHRLDKPWLAESLQGIRDQGAGETHFPLSLPPFSPEVLSALATLTGNDSDGDGLSDTQEQMWCTSPTNPDSDGDGAGDGSEVQAAKDWLAHETDTYPLNGKPFTNWPPQLANCPDDDQDSVPDMAERWELMGLSMNRESTDGDKFDDGQELFGRTYCPGGAGQCGYGALPRTVDTWLGAEMPSWVLPPGNNPFVAAYPVIDFQVDPATIHVVTKEIRTVERTITQGEEISTGFAETDGHATTVGTIDTNTHSTWQENSTTEGGIEPGARRLAPAPAASRFELAPALPAVLLPQVSTPGAQAESPRWVPGTVSAPAGVLLAAGQALTAAVLPAKMDAYAVTDVQDWDEWQLVSAIGLQGLGAGQAWNLEDNGAWFGLLLAHREKDLSWTATVEGSAEFSALLAQLPGTRLSPQARAELDPRLRPAAVSGSAYHFPWGDGSAMQYGSRGVHGNEFSVTPGWKAVDFISDGNSGAGHASNQVLAAVGGAISWVCQPANGATSTAFRIDGLFYTHLQYNAARHYVGAHFDQDEALGSLKTGSFSENCGYADQQPGAFHLHWGFADSSTFQVEQWSLSTADGLWRRNDESYGSGHWFVAEHAQAGAPLTCDVPDLAAGDYASSATLNDQYKGYSFWESIGQWFGGWLGQLSGGGSWATEASSTLPGCDGASCAGQVSSYTGTPLNYSDYRSDGQCGNGGSFYPEGGALYGMGGGGSGTAFNDNGDGTFDRLRIWSETRTSGEGFSTSHSELRSDTTYKEVTRSQTNTLVSSEAWSTATTLDPTDAATLTFNYSLHNQGSDLAVNLVNIDINLLIGDLPVLTWRAPNRSGIQPGQTVGPFGSEAIQLSLDQLAAIDNGAPIRVVLADYGYDDSLYEQNAWGRSVLFHVDDGLADGDRRVDTYLIAAGLVVSETYQDVLSRYFPVEVFDAGPSDPRSGTLTNIRTPEFDGTGQITAWVDHPVNERAWWELSISAGGETGGVSHFKDMPAKPRTDVYLRYLEDSDGDAYTDRAELDAFSDPENPEIHPRPLLIAAQHTLTDTNTALVQLSLQNNGNFDASSVEVWAIAANDTISITDNLVGGGGRVRAGGHVVLGARIGAPDLTAWPTGTAKPYLGGQFEGTAAKTYSFRADTSGTVGNSAGLTVSWSENGVNWTLLAVGSGYTAGDWLNVADGVQIAFTAGTIVAGETFVAEAALPIDTFAYTLQSPEYTPPLIVVSYNDPQGNHKFVSPVEVEHIQDDLTFSQGDMRFGLQLDAYAPEAVEAGANSAQVVFYNPAETAITGGKLFLEFATPDGTVAKEYVLAGQSFLPGPNLFTVPWNTADFTPAYDPSVGYHLLAFVTDYQGTILENTVKDLEQLGRDPLAAAELAEDAWDIGSVPQGTLLHKDLTLANTGFAPLKVYATGENVGFAASFLTVAPATFQTLHLTLDTGQLDTGTLDTSFTLRTNDPARPLFTVNVSGEITVLTAEALAQPVDEYRPWDQYVYVPGPQEINAAITFTHTIPDNPAAMHPLYVYAEDGGTLLGVGEYGPDFTGTTAPFGIFGDGRDGDLTVAAGQTVYVNDVHTHLISETVAGQTSLGVNSTAGFAAGDQVLLIQTLGPGEYEVATLQQVLPGKLILRQPVEHNYLFAAPIRSPNCSSGYFGEYFNNTSFAGSPALTRCDPTINFSWGNGSPGGGVNADYFSVRWTGVFTLPFSTYLQIEVFPMDDGARIYVDDTLLADRWSGWVDQWFTLRPFLTAGAHTFRFEYHEEGGGATIGVATNTPLGGQVVKIPNYRNVTVESGGKITASAWNGYSGGIVAFRVSESAHISGTVDVNGAGYYGGGGGTGGGNAGTSGAGTAGGAFGNGIFNNGNGGGGGRAGWTQGGADGGGGSLGTYGGNGANGDGGTGYGGLRGELAGSNDFSTMAFGGGGGAGGHQCCWPDGANGGSGGGIVWIASRDLWISGSIIANGRDGMTYGSGPGSGGGGAGGSVLLNAQHLRAGTNQVSALGGNGYNGAGYGGNGRIRLEYCDSLSGTTNPPASTQQITCYITRQAPGNPGNTELLLPEAITGSTRYRAQYDPVPGPQATVANEPNAFPPATVDNSAAMHPLYVYAEDGGTLLGVGEYGPDFTGTTAPFGIFGDGRDGDLTVATGQTVVLNQTRTNISASGSNASPASSAGFAAGDVVLFHQTQGTANVGRWEFAQIAMIDAPTSWTLVKPLAYSYDSANGRAQAIKVPQYQNVTLDSGGALTAPAWDGTTGGILVFKANGQVLIQGVIDLSGRGFRGGAGSHRCACQAVSGETYSGVGSSCCSPGCKVPANNGGGGNGGDYGGGTAGGCGAGYGTQGGQAPQGWNMSGFPYGVPDLSAQFLGSGGGGGYEDNAPCNGTGGAGGNGGGIFIAYARFMSLQGNVLSKGAAGVSVPTPPGAGGGGGSGGSILLTARDLNVVGSVDATGGSGGIGSYSGANGGAGAVGRIRIEYCNSLSGTTNPPASTQQITCYITRQAPASPQNTELLLPAAVVDFARYQIQYGQRGTFTAAEGTQEYTLTLPKHHYLAATLDALFENLGNSTFNFSLDVGADGSLEWSGSGSQQPALLTSPDLATGLNAYLSSTADPWGANVAVPIRLTLDTTGDVFLTNVALSPGADADLQAGTEALSASSANPVETDIISLTLTARNPGALPAENVLVSFFAGNPQEGGTYLGSVLLPPLPSGGTATGAIAWDTTGYQGNVELYAVLDAAGQLLELDEGNNTASLPMTVRARPDLQVAAITLEGPARQGIPNTISVAVANRGGSDAPAQAVSLYSGDPLAGGLLIGSASTAIASGVTETVSIPWIPTDLGTLTLYAMADSAGAVPEFDENNNQRTLSGYVGWGAPLYLDAGGSPDPAYDPALGYGFLTAGTAVSSCGSQPSQTYRQAASGETIQYRFDHLLPERFYHLDLSFFLCSGSRTQRVLVDGMEIANNIVVSATPASRSLLLDPSLYADHSIVVTLEKTGGGLGGPVVSELLLTDIRYCSRDSGLPAEQAYAGAPDGCGWLDGSADQSWGTLPYQSVRYDDDGNLHYRFDQLSAGLDFRLNFTFFEGDAAGRIESVSVDGQSVLQNLVLSATPQFVSAEVPAGAYADGWIDVSIQGAAQPVISEIGLEQKTVVERPLSADLEIGMNATPDPVSAGGTLTYHLAVTNHGPDAAPGVTVLDGLPPQVTLLSALPGQGSCSGTQTVVCSLGSLAAGATATLTLQVTVGPEASGLITNSASVTASAGDGSPGNNLASATTTISPQVEHRVFLPLVKR